MSDVKAQTEAGKIEVLFVNDDRDELDRLQSELRQCTRRWSMRFIWGPDEALAELEKRPAQIVVCDMRMQGMDGAVFLAVVRKKYPETVRFVLARSISRSDAERVMPIAHQVLMGPGDMVAVQRAIERVTALMERVENPVVQRAIAAVHNLPPLPDAYRRLTLELDSPDVTSARVAAIIERDPAVTTRLLQAANSPYYSFGRPVRTVQDAATRLGMQQLRSIVLLMSMGEAKSPMRLPKGFSMLAVQNRSQRVAGLATSMLSNAEERKIAFSAGMLHHVGYFVLAAGMPEEYGWVMAAADVTSRTIEQVEAELLGCDHAEVGAFMLTLLGLPLPIVEAVAHHHRPSASGDRRFGPATAVHVACLLAAQTEGHPVVEEAWDASFLERLGAQDIVGRWRAGEAIKPVF